ncbi:DUF3038 domain-containing protein [Synechococcales cyanobacterium C]|uniref:DUF3038 domain-containing protein n=1 Tax=Petrachloros mirabilis ULC683 TaxID=2781853 RepID=A0A8K1ZZP8_9CYAN|nr:DUF3038 domain-containing protein [Petrachloros mirabilis]NCJ06911.1 DUF3038 domain-containing protein [Petrachloros mirabilis ULC683]
MEPSRSTQTARTFRSPPLTGLQDPLPDGAQLDNIKTQIDLVLLSLESLTHLGSEAMLQAAEALGVQEMVGDRVALWRLRQSNPMRRGSGGRKKLDIEEARSLVLMSCYLAQEHQDTIRDAVTCLEELTAQNRRPYQAPILGDYLDRFTNLYQERMEEDVLSTQDLMTLALRLLVDLLFYSAPQGARRLWLALLDRATTKVP